MLAVVGDYLVKYPKLSWAIHVPACALTVALNYWMFG